MIFIITYNIVSSLLWGDFLSFKEDLQIIKTYQIICSPKILLEFWPILACTCKKVFHPCSSRWEFWKGHYECNKSCLVYLKFWSSHLDVVPKMIRCFNKMSVAWKAGGNTMLCEVYITSAAPIRSSQTTVQEAHHISFDNSVFITTILLA